MRVLLHWGSLEICSLLWGAVSRKLIGNLGASQSSCTVVDGESYLKMCVLRCYKASLPSGVLDSVVLGGDSCHLRGPPGALTSLLLLILGMSLGGAMALP